MSKEAELSVLCSMILKNEAIGVVGEKLTSKMFTNQYNRDVFDKMMELDAKGIPVDEVQLQTINVPMKYIADLFDYEPHGESAEYHADIVLESYRKAEVKRLAQDLAAITSGSGTASDWIVEADKAFRDRTEFNEAEKEHVADIVETVKFGKDGSNRIPTGFNGIDDTILGVDITDYVIIAGRPGMGKTSLMVDILTDISGIRGIPASFYSCEMSPQQIVKRMCSAISGVPLFRVESKNAYPLEDDVPKLEQASRQISTCPMYIKSAGGISPSRLKRMIANDRRKYGVKIAFVDHLHLMRADKPTGSGYQDLTSISRAVKQIVLETGVPIIMGCQLSRTEEAKEPRLTDLRGTGAIEEDADIVIGIHRPSYWTMEPDIDAEFHILKGRHFGTGVGEAEFHGQITSFQDKP